MLSFTNATQAEKTTALPPHSIRQKISLQIDISVSKNALTSIFFLAMYQYLWFGDIYDTEAEKTLILHMPAQVIACPPLSHRLVYLFFCLFAWTPTLHMPGQVIAKSQLIFS